MNDHVRALWARVILRAHPELLQLVSLPADQIQAAVDLVAGEASPFAAFVKEPGGISITISEQAWLANRDRFTAARSAGPYRVITLDLEVDPLVSGFLAPGAARLAAVGIAMVPQCGYLRDHLLVAATDVERALEALGDLIKDCGRQ